MAAMVFFELEYMPLEALVLLANAASREFKAYETSDTSDLDLLGERFEIIARAIEDRVASGQDIGGKPIPEGWAFSDHVVIPENL